ncbi:hypothetical protein NN3_35160 [Nocardia neocaledoniensis NBRC 108232]|nr:hypothetical protein NN3_35160 [Nocardia neocaledoniensis NBRC 108232]
MGGGTIGVQGRQVTDEIRALEGGDLRVHEGAGDGVVGAVGASGVVGVPSRVEYLGGGIVRHGRQAQAGEFREGAGEQAVRDGVARQAVGECAQTDEQPWIVRGGNVGGRRKITGQVGQNGPRLVGGVEYRVHRGEQVGPRQARHTQQSRFGEVGQNKAQPLRIGNRHVLQCGESESGRGEFDAARIQCGEHGADDGIVQPLHRKRAEDRDQPDDGFVEGKSARRLTRESAEGVTHSGGEPGS